MKSLPFLFACLLVASACQARTITVDDDGPADFDTIQAAIDDSNDGGTVVVNPGTYTGDGNRDIDFKGKAITVRSIDPNDPNIVAATVIDCQGSEREPHRGFCFYSRKDFDAVLSGLTITNGWESKGGAIYCDEHCSPTITYCSIINNSANRGGGIYCKGPGGRPVISNCRISRNSASGPSDLFIYGGGIACDDLASPLIKSCLITDNSAEAGGGAYFYGRNAHLAHCTVVGNSATEGEGIWCTGPDRPERRLLITNSIVWGNSGAGGPDIAGSAPIVSYSNVEGGYPGNSNIDTDPLFINPSIGDYHLSAGSLCIDAGDPEYQYDKTQTDIDGQSRIMGICTDIGADEFRDEVYCISHRLVFLAKQDWQNPATQTILIEDIYDDATTWQLVGNCPWLEAFPNQGHTTGESFEVMLSINISGLEPGSYSCQLQIVPDIAANCIQIVIVDLHISRNIPLHVPHKYPTIQSAIDAAAWGDVILVDPGTYNENINFNGKNITLTSTDPNDPNVVDTTVIRGDRTASVVTFSGTEKSTCILSGFEITGGNAFEPSHGGGIQGNGTKARISNCHITKNISYRRGGGLFDCDGLVAHCLISDNEAHSAATAEGGGLHSCDGSIEDCTIANNHSGSFLTSGFGGGLYQCHGTITRCTITHNEAGGKGGGLYDCDGLIADCIIAHNDAQSYAFASRGGGLSGCDGTVRNCAIKDNIAYTPHGGVGGGLAQCRADIQACTISGNWSHHTGGGVASCDTIRDCLIGGNSCAGDGAGLSKCSSIQNCIISNNMAVGNGAGVHNCGQLVNCTIAGNRANGNGGAIYCQGGGTVAGCILRNNTAAKGNEIYLDTYIVYGRGGSYEFPSTITLRYSNVQRGAAGVYLEDDCIANWVGTNIDADPCFADPGYWDPNGTPEDVNDDFWLDGDYHLKSQAGRLDPVSQNWVQDDVTSPCIDAGDPASPIGHEPFPNAGIINMGAYGGTAEASKSYFGDPVCETIVAGDINGDCRVDFADFALMAFHWLADGSP